MTAKRWSLLLLSGVLAVLVLCAGAVAVVDPCFHYHAPLPGLYYRLIEERSMNNGILRHFDYDAFIIGTSMSQNFKTSEFDSLFGVHSVKTAFSGSTYREQQEQAGAAFRYHGGVRMVLWGLDCNKITNAPDAMRYTSYPDWLYDDDPFNDVNYLLSQETLGYLGLDLAMTLLGRRGVTPFDEYRNWSGRFSYGAEAVRAAMEQVAAAADLAVKNVNQETVSTDTVLTEEDRETIRANIETNIAALTRENPDTLFYCFWTPYSIAWWYQLWEAGTLEKQIDAEETALPLLLECENIRLFSFNLNTDLTCDLDNYKDAGHYGEWVNSWMLEQMRDGAYLLTEDNYQDYLAAERAFYEHYDYAALWED